MTQGDRHRRAWQSAFSWLRKRQVSADHAYGNQRISGWRFAFMWCVKARGSLHTARQKFGYLQGELERLCFETLRLQTARRRIYR